MQTNTTEPQLSLQHDYNVPVDALYRAWTEAEQLKQWWRPMGNVLKALVNELQPGGRVEYVFETAEGTPAFTIRGTYKEVEEGRRLVYTWNWELPGQQVGEAPFLLHVAFEAQGEGSRIHVRQEQFQNEEHVQPHRDGWEDGLSSLARYLEGR